MNNSQTIFQPLKVMLVLLALGGCSAPKTDVAVGPVPAFLHSEFSQLDTEASFFGPFVVATQAQQNSKNLVSAHYFLQAHDADPSSKFVADRAFFQLIVSGRLEDAAALAAKLQGSAEVGTDDLVRLMHALEAFKRQDWAAARARLDGGFSRGFGFIISPLLTAWSHGAEDNVEGAQRALDALAKNKRLQPLVDEHLAYILDYMGQNAEAAEQYDVVFGQNSQGVLHPSIAYAHMLVRTGRQQAADAFLKKQLKTHGNNGILRRESRRISGGQRPTQQVATPLGAAGLVFYRLATEFARSASPEAAIIYFRIASYLTPDVADIYFMLGELFSDTANLEGAVAALGAVPKTSALKPQAEMRQIELLRASAKLDQAEELLRAGLAEKPEDKIFLVGLADLLQQRQMFAESIPFYNRAIMQIRKPVRRDWYLYFARAISYERTGNWPEAEKNLKIALSVNPGEPNTLNYLGYSWIDRGENIKEAKGMIEQAVKTRPNDGAIQDSLGWVYYLTGDFNRAVTTLERAVRLEPDDATINDHLGDAYWQVGRKLEARFQWQHALDSDIAEKEQKAVRMKLESGLLKMPAPKTDSAKSVS
ncbi:MAG: tetratricopeptide repeat protein [Kordiimonadaceae bacterium]|nr:tetratricopeptide repeat protein [Kordiimonadaceae bacterium]